MFCSGFKEKLAAQTRTTFIYNVINSKNHWPLNWWINWIKTSSQNESSMRWSMGILALLVAHLDTSIQMCVVSQWLKLISILVVGFFSFCCLVGCIWIGFWMWCTVGMTFIMHTRCMVVFLTMNVVIQLRDAIGLCGCTAMIICLIQCLSLVLTV